MKKLIILLLLCGQITLHAQDIIVKSDQTEIKVKVTEIAETAIKYKKWDNLDGPLYNISKTEVFMIIYANGKRETILQQPVAHTVNTDNRNTAAPSVLKTPPAAAGQTGKPSIDTVIDYKKVRVKYSPYQFVYWFDSPVTTMGVATQTRVVKNLLNVGISADYFFLTDAQQTMYGIYLSPYLPLNRLLKNYKNQDKGLFVFAKLGYAAISYTVKGNSSTTGDVMAGIGADYFFSKHIGISMSADKYGEGKFNFKGGICFK